MDIHEFNNHLRASLVKISDDGFKTSDMSKILFQGMTSQLARFIKEETNFGIKPITTLGTQMEYEIHVVAVKKTDANTQLIDDMERNTISFFEELYIRASDCLALRSSDTAARSRNTVSRETIDAILNDIEL